MLSNRLRHPRSNEDVVRLFCPNDVFLDKLNCCSVYFRRWCVMVSENAMAIVGDHGREPSIRLKQMKARGLGAGGPMETCIRSKETVRSRT